MTLLGPVILAATCAAAGLCAWIVGARGMGRFEDLRARQRKLALDDLVREPVLAGAFFVAVAFLLAAATSFSALPVLLVAALVLARRLPVLVERSRARELREACDARVDVMADIVGMGVRAGLAFDAALALYCQKFDDVLAVQMRSALVRWQGGMASRERALKDLATRIGSASLRRFTDTVAQAVAYGSPLADMLARFSRDVRAQRRSQLEQRVAKAPVKMLVPTGVCILPAMLILVMGPVVIQFISSGF